MWFSSFLQLGFVATMFYSPVTATDRPVQHVSDLKLEFSDSPQGWRLFDGPGEFSASVSVSALEKSMTISQMSNDENLVDSDEALLSIWEHDSGLDAGELRHVKFNNIDLDSDVEVLNEAFKKLGTLTRTSQTDASKLRPVIIRVGVSNMSPGAQIRTSPPQLRSAVEDTV
ncbi:hypothetical protein CFIMG_008224RA00001 [Ceratocystis fimbriata CBS 114723]|uniref:Uncharacterized protein n=1 Tax=Ceratocystis fimbriata CBS 114723 TaxID=1035309 RepID=A0A2C5X6F1_9PEZI|nr:hypothetical protein CFIMG_008224RA00001 [Ceratocystis fimbriata CBS 114723]